MNNSDIRVRVDGREAHLERLSSISVSNPPPSALNEARSASASQWRDRLTKLVRHGIQNEFSKRFPGQPISVGFSMPGEDPFLVDTKSGARVHIYQGEIKLRCGVKLMASSLLHEHLALRHCHLETTIAEALGISTIQGNAGTAITIEHLLNHRHGLEDFGIRVSDIWRDGWIDLPRMISLVDTKAARLAPGARYSYSRVGYWLIAALLQKLEGRSYTDILKSQGFRLTGVICPAMGLGCEISAMDLLAFLVHRLNRAKSSGMCTPVAPSDANTVTLPGWNVVEKGIQLGWKVFHRGWLGHNAVSRTERGLIRVHPDTGAAIYLFAPTTLLPGIARYLFDGILPETAAPSIPRRLSPAQWHLKDQTSYSGVFRMGSGYLRVQAADEGLSAVLDHTSNSSRSRRLKFAPAEGDLFFTLPLSLSIPFIQYLYSPSGAADAIWNGTRVWPRVANHDGANVA